MTFLPLLKEHADAIPVWLAHSNNWNDVEQNLPPFIKLMARAHGFKAQKGKHILAVNGQGKIEGVLFGISTTSDAGFEAFDVGALPGLLPAGIYEFASPLHKPDLSALAWLLGSYSFRNYTSKSENKAQLVLPKGVHGEEIMRIASAIYLGRDLINTPANDLGPKQLESAIDELAQKHKISTITIRGKALLDENFPLIYAVGKGAEQEPRLITFQWGDKKNPLISIVGKGVTFDTGGLDIKPSSSMLLMKKDMGGAATALALADMIMGSNLPVRLRLTIPIVENAISGPSFRPGDIYRSRKGKSIEIGNTDAEGRLILADALTFADEENPDLLIDFATLTGAARVALGPDIPAFFTKNESLALEVQHVSKEIQDPVWRLPLWEPYQNYIKPDDADLNNSSNAPFAGSITAALFLNHFVEKTVSYLHFDVFAWSPQHHPARPKGGDIQAARLIYTLLKKRYEK